MKLNPVLLQCVLMLSLWWRPTCLAQVKPEMSVVRLPESVVVISWPESPGTHVLQVADELPPSGRWRASSERLSLNNGRFEASVDSTSRERFFRVLILLETNLPPDPAMLATPLEAVGTTPYADSIAFLYTGTNAIQTGVTPGTIHPQRAAVLRGRVQRRDGSPLSGVTIGIKDHPEYGQTLSRADGMFDLVINGGGMLTVSYQLKGYCPVHRPVMAPWQNYSWLPDVVMIQMDPLATTVTLGPGTSQQVASGSIQSDADGARQARLILPPGTSAALQLPDGSTVPASSLVVRATEFTVGPTGPAAMPAPLPPASGYTYCVELTADEAEAAGAVSVRFDQPLSFYVENFLEFPTGEPVPVGYYDRQLGAWVPSENGRVIKVLRIAGNLAELDTTGDGVADNGVALGVTDLERQKLAELYAPGQTLWRVLVRHFTPWDHNWPFGPPSDAIPPPPPPPPPPRPKDPCEEPGSVIEVQNQVLGEAIRIPGTAFELVYRSDRVVGRTDSLVADLPLLGNSVPASLKRVEVALMVEGVRYAKTLTPSPGLRTQITWDGRDVYGRYVDGFRLAQVDVTFIYPPEYKATAEEFEASFAGFGGTAIGGSFEREITISRRWRIELGHSDGRLDGFGGWKLNIQHRYDPVARQLALADGATVSEPALVDRLLAGSGMSLGNGGTATNAFLERPQDVVYDALGNLYIAESAGVGLGRVRKVSPGGIITIFAGRGGARDERLGDDGPATNAVLSVPTHLDIGPDGSIYISDSSIRRIRKVDTNGIISNVAGGGPLTPTNRLSNGIAATNAFLFGEAGARLPIAIGQDGTLYIATEQLIRQVGPDGLIRTIAGVGGFSAETPDGQSAVGASLLGIHDIALGPDGSIYYARQSAARQGPERIRRIGTDGILSTLAGPGTNTVFQLNGVPATESRLGLVQYMEVGGDGSIYFSERLQNTIRKVGPDGIITTLAGLGTIVSRTTGELAIQAMYNEVRGITLAPDGSIAFAVLSDQQVRSIQPTQPLDVLGQFVAAAPNGREIYVFDLLGRHLHTLDAFTARTNVVFGYGADEQLATVTDADGLVTRVERDPNGNPSAIVGPFGQRVSLALDARGYLASVTLPGGAQYRMTYNGESGLIATFTDPRNKTSTLGYDALGRLIRDENAAGEFQALSRVDLMNAQVVGVSNSLAMLSKSFRVETLPDGTSRRVSSNACCLSIELTNSLEGVQFLTQADGTRIELQTVANPRFGMMAPLPGRFSVILPSGLMRTGIFSRTITLNNPNDPLSLALLADSTEINGLVASRSWHPPSGTLTNISPEGDVTVATLDLEGHLVQLQLDTNVAPLQFAYDALGRLTNATWGPQSRTYSYGQGGEITQMADATGVTLEFEHDTAGRSIALSLPGGIAHRFAYDAAGNITNVIMPSGAVHEFTYDNLGRVESYRPPGAGTPHTRSFTGDGLLETVTYPSGRQRTRSYDGNRRLAGWTAPDGTVTFAYLDGTSRFSTLECTPMSTAHPQRLQFEYDGMLVTSSEWSGAAKGTYRYTYDPHFAVTNIAFTSGTNTHQLSLTRNRDGLVTNAGPFVMIREGPGGAVTRITDGALVVIFEYDAISRLVSRRHEINGAEVFRLELEYDDAYRVIRKMETAAGVLTVHDYTYDASKRLVEVKRDGAVHESYQYDVNGNRTRRQIGGTAPELSTFDPVDRIISRGTATYAFNADGQLTARGSDSFAYGTRGELLQAEMAGQRITYSYDALGRRTARTDAASTTEYLYGHPDNLLQVTHTRDATGVPSAYYYDDAGILLALDRGGTRYYVACDHLGSPRLVTDTDGDVLKTITYRDGYGLLENDSNPTFELPIGFAGGLGDSTTGLIRFGWRDYEPESGTWLLRDPTLFHGGSANLYAYVYGNPVSYRDPAGAFAIGFSSYAGIGAGAKFSFDSSGVSLCGEVGFGVGGGLEVNPFASIESDSNKIKAEAGVGVGPAGLGGEIELDDCGRLTKKFKGELGPFTIDTDEGLIVGGELEDLGDSLLDLLTEPGFEAEAKIAGEVCRAWSF